MRVLNNEGLRQEIGREVLRPLRSPRLDRERPSGQDVCIQKIAVAYDYPVYFTRDVFSPSNHFLAEAVSRREPMRRHRLLFIVEQAVADAWPELVTDMSRYAEHHPDILELLAVPLLLPGGEEVKNDPAILERLHRYMNEYALDRQSFAVCVGGGALLDAVGYAAATAHRGVRLIRVPTTVLSQNDSGVGVKNGVNAFGKKNFLGTFAPPFAVLNDIRFIETLSRRDMIAGMSEAVKVALIRDSAFFEWLTEHTDALNACEPTAIAHLIRRCAELHLTHIATSGDPFEFGSARPLDFGHWAAHKLETLTEHRLRHGEAVAIGIALDTIYSSKAGYLSATVVEEVVTLLERLGFRLWDEALDHRGPDGRLRVMDGLTEFREHLGGELTVTLLRRIGGGFEVNEIHDDLMLESIDWLRRRDGIR